MIKKINKIMALILITTSIVTTTSITPFAKIANAAGSTISTTSQDDQIFYVIKGYLDKTYASQNCVVLSSSTPVATIPLTVDSDVTSIIADNVNDSVVKEALKQKAIQDYKTAHNTNTVPDAVVTQINKTVDNMSSAQLDAAKAAVIKTITDQIKNLAGDDVPIYAFKAVDKTDMTTVKDQGYFVGGKAGYAIMQQTGKPLVVSESQLDKTVIGKITKQIISKLAEIDANAKQAVDKVTSSLDDISDSLNDLTDELKDKNDDVNDAWDKVFDRFDNEPGWGKKDGYVYYYDKDGVSLKGVQNIKGKTYYFNRIDGAMETGWQIVDGKRCYFDKKKGYELFNQWIQDGDDYYFVGNDGVAKKMQWVNDGGKSYYLKADGKMTRDWLKIDDYWYFFNKSGSMETANWKWSDGKWYYLKENGQAATKWTQIGDKFYYFKDPSGEMQSGWFRADGNWYCTNDDGSMKTGWAASKDKWCYLDETTGIMKKNEWVTVDGKTYYFNINGEMVTGSRYVDGTKYIFNSDGTLS